MNATMDIGRNRAGLITTEARAEAGRGSFSAFNLLAGGMHGFMPPGQAVGSGPPDFPHGRGLDRIENKFVPNGRLRTAQIKVDLPALWVSVSFAAVFVLGCLTLA